MASNFANFMVFYKLSDSSYRTFNYKNQEYKTIRNLMNENIELHINSDYEYFVKTPKDHHPSKKCHRIIADAVIKKIEETKTKKIRYESKFI